MRPDPRAHLPGRKGAPVFARNPRLELVGVGHYFKFKPARRSFVSG